LRLLNFNRPKRQAQVIGPGPGIPLLQLRTFQTEKPRLPAPQRELSEDGKINVDVDFELLCASYEAHGAEGVYAALREEGVALDSRHGNFLIKSVFMPAYEEHIAKQAAKPSVALVAVPPEPNKTP